MKSARVEPAIVKSIPVEAGKSVVESAAVEAAKSVMEPAAVGLCSKRASCTKIEHSAQEW